MPPLALCLLRRKPVRPVRPCNGQCNDALEVARGVVPGKFQQGVLLSWSAECRHGALFDIILTCASAEACLAARAARTKSTAGESGGQRVWSAKVSGSSSSR